MENAAWTTTSAPAKARSRALGSRMSAGVTVVRPQPSSRPSRGRRAVATTRATRSSASSSETTSRPTVPVAPVTATVSGSVMALHVVADQPEHRSPETHEDRAALGVAASRLVDGLGADPQRQRQRDAGQGGDMQGSCDHAAVVPRAGRSSSADPPGTGLGMASQPNRVLTTLSWPFGLMLTWWSYVWCITPLHRREVEGDPAVDGVPPLPPGTFTEGIQHPGEGSGALLRRRYR